MEAITENSSESKMDVDNTETIISQEKGKQDEEPLNSSKESEAENLEAIKDFIAAQEQEIIDIRTRKKNAESEAEKEAKASENHLETEASIAISLEDNHNDSRDKQDDIISTSTNEQTSPSIIKHLAGVTDEDVNYLVDVQHDISHDDIAHSVDVKEDINSVDVNEDMTAEAAHVMDMLLTETEAKLAAESESKAGELEKKSPEKPTAKQIMSTFEKGKTMALSVGSKVEARDFGEDWHPAQILEVDFEEMEVLVHYESINKKLVRPDEWISVSSPRLRPEGSGPLKPPTPSPEQISEPDESAVTVKEEIKHEEKPKLTFEAGERCLARWRDNRRFIATIGANLGEGVYEIVFDDGVRWSCNKTRLSKLKDCLDTSLPYTSTPSPDPGPSGSQPPLHSQPLYHTHLFDPARDYLGTKSERRERKRKLNIKEIFNIGQKKPKILDTPKTSKPRVRPPPKDRKPKVVKKPLIVASEVKVEIKDEIPSIKINEVPEAVASIIGTVQEELKQEEIKEIKEETSEFATDDGNNTDTKIEMDDSLDLANSETLSAPESFEIKLEDGQGVDGEARLEKFEQQDNSQSGEVIDRIKEVITKLEDGLSEIETKTDIIKNIDSPKVLIKEEDRILADLKPVPEDVTKKNLAKVKKGKKLRLLQEKKVKKQVERVKSELEVMKKQMEEMKQAMLMKTEEIAKGKGSVEIPESFLLPGEWCCKWVNGQPVGTVSEMEGDLRIGVDNKPGLPRRSVQVEDKRLPPGWTKHMVRRSFGTSAGKWDVVLVSPENRRFHTKTEMRHYFEHNPSVAESLKEYQPGLFDFGVHLKLSRRMGWYTVTPDGQQSAPTFTLPAGTLSTTSPLVKRKKLSLTKKERRERDRLRREKDRDRHNKSKLSKSALLQAYANYPSVIDSPRIDEPQAGPSIPSPILQLKPPPPPSAPEPLEAGFVFVGSLKVQIIENLLRCPAEGCFKNFRNNTLLKMHIKHYHRELTKMLGITPKVLDLAYARTRPSVVEMRKLKLEAGKKTIKVKLPKLPKRSSDKHDPKDVKIEPQAEPTTPVKADVEKTPRSVESPKLRQALGKPVKRRPKVLLPVRKPVLPETAPKEIKEENIKQETPLAPKSELPIEPLDFETAISTHTVTKPGLQGTQKKRKSFASVSKIHSEDDDWMGSDPDTRSSYPRSGTPDSKNMDHKLMSSESNEDQKDANNYMYTETGERIKIVHMKREEIINCHCGFREEDGLMVQCELCLCWQHALCHNIQKESDVPDKYTCSICLNPRRGRRSQRFLHDQDRLYEGLLPGAKPCETLRRSHELSGNLLRIEDALHALKVKYFVATKKDHPKLYLWAKDWETGEISIMQEKLNSDYSDLNIMISSIGKENLPIKDEKDMQLEIKTPPSEDTEIERFSQKDNQIGSQALLSGLLSSPGGASLDLPISTSELERLAKTVQEEAQRVAAPQPEAAIENSACRERLLRHIQRCQALVDARLDSIEAQVAELESQDPSFEDDETADFFPRTKQTVQMLMRDLDTMEELGVIT